MQITVPLMPAAYPTACKSKRARWATKAEDIPMVKVFVSICHNHGVLCGERRWLRPTLEVVGIYGGFSGVGIKTIVPAKATAKISCRLVPDQDPDHVVAVLKAHVERHAPPQTRLKFTPLPFRANPYIMPRGTLANRAAAKVMAAAHQEMCYLPSFVVTSTLQWGRKIAFQSGAVAQPDPC